MNDFGLPDLLADFTRKIFEESIDLLINKKNKISNPCGVLLTLSSGYALANLNAILGITKDIDYLHTFRKLINQTIDDREKEFRKELNRNEA